MYLKFPVLSKEDWYILKKIWTFQVVNKYIPHRFGKCLKTKLPHTEDNKLSLIRPEQNNSQSSNHNR